ncbi:hypothetical protein [Caudoviricetes sp.]|nr:hypothetical protein [Caudoviricetes sp.]
MGGITSRISKAPIELGAVLLAASLVATTAVVASITVTQAPAIWQELAASAVSASAVDSDITVTAGGITIQNLAAAVDTASAVAVGLTIPGQIAAATVVVSSVGIIVNVQPAIEDPLQIAAYGTALLKRWHRGDDVVLASGKVAQWTDKSGNGNHGIGTAPRQPTWLADGGNGMPAVQGLGDNEAGTSNRDELRWPGYARPAPGTTPNFQIIVWRKDGNELGVDRTLVADSTLRAFQLKRPSASASAAMALVNGTTNEMSNTAYVQDTVICTEWLFTNSLESYHKVQGVVASGSFGGNNVGTAASMFVTQAGTAWMAATVWELIEFWGIPTVLQLSKLHAYLANRYTGLVV